MSERKRRMTPEMGKDYHEMEQSRSFVIDNLPPLWYGLYRKCMKEGFDTNQAMELVKVYINTTLGVGRYLGKMGDHNGSEFD
jgi:hypothetical protein